MVEKSSTKVHSLMLPFLHLWFTRISLRVLMSCEHVTLDIRTAFKWVKAFSRETSGSQNNWVEVKNSCSFSTKCLLQQWSNTGTGSSDLCNLSIYFLSVLVIILRGIHSLSFLHSFLKIPFHDTLRRFLIEISS